MTTELRIRSRHRGPILLLPLPFLLAGSGLLGTGQALAEEENTGDAAGPAKAAENAEDQPPAQRRGSAAKAAPTPGGEQLSFVEHLPASAFPDPPRGIYGGSLFLGTFHGLQWPYIPRTGVGISGSAWVDTGYEKITRGENHPNTVYWIQQGRALLRVTPTYSDGRVFVQAQAELVANKDQTQKQPDVADTDDLWVRAGVWNSWDVQAGRFEAWELYHLGMGLDLHTLERDSARDTSAGAPPDFYGVTTAFYRPSGVGNVAVHAYPTHWLRFEALAQAGDEGGNNAIGGRPAGIVDFNWFRLKVGAEWKRTTGTTQQVSSLKDNNGNMVVDVNGQPVFVKTDSKEKTVERGAGGGIQFMFYPYLEFGVNAAIGLSDYWDPQGSHIGAKSFTTTSMGGFANVRVIEDVVAGTGVEWTARQDTNTDLSGRVGHFNNLQIFGALQYLLFKQLFVKAVVAYAQARFDPSYEADPNTNVNFTNSMVSGRVRLLYLF